MLYLLQDLMVACVSCRRGVLSASCGEWFLLRFVPRCGSRVHELFLALSGTIEFLLDGSEASRDRPQLRCNVTGIIFAKNISCNGTLLSGITEEQCVQPTIGSLNPAIHNAYHASLHPSSLFESRTENNFSPRKQERHSLNTMLSAFTHRQLRDVCCGVVLNTTTR